LTKGTKIETVTQ